MKPLIHLVGGILVIAASHPPAAAIASAPATTTVYVGPHFELRNHDEPVKYVFHGGRRVARITGSLAQNLRIQQLRLYQGWNLSSLAVASTNAVEQLSLTPGGTGGISSAYLWNPASRAFEAVAPNQSLMAGSILWLKAASNYIAKVVGTYAEPVAAQIVSDGAWLSGSGLEKWSPILPEAATLWKYDAFTGMWQPTYSSLLAPLGQPKPMVAPGDAVYVHTAEPIELQPADPQLRLAYYHQDHLGSAAFVTDADGSVVEATSYYPSGAKRHEELVRAIETHYGFSQKERDDESGLLYFGHRYEHPALGRWISTDPLGEKGGGPNPYAYVDNNPLKLRDPDGSEITVAEETKGDTITYHIKLKAVLIDVSSKKFDQKQLAAYKAKLVAQIESSFKGKGKGWVEPPKGKPKQMNFVWDASADIRVVSDWSQVERDDHVFRIVDQTSTRASGDTKRGHMLINIQARVLNRPPPDQWDKVPPEDPRLPWSKYHQPEAVGAHEFGHAAGLPHWNMPQNLMTEGEQQDYKNVQIDLTQIRKIVSASKNNEINKRDELLDQLTTKK
jgi:RHS repeat-associated protein